MVITTQAGRSYLAGAGTGYGISSAPEINPNTGDKVKDYYDRTGSTVYVISEGCHVLGRYETLDRAKKVAADFKNAVDNGAQAFNFPAK